MVIVVLMPAEAAQARRVHVAVVVVHDGQIVPPPSSVSPTALADVCRQLQSRRVGVPLRIVIWGPASSAVHGIQRVPVRGSGANGRLKQRNTLMSLCVRCQDQVGGLVTRCLRSKNPSLMADCAQEALVRKPRGDRK